MGLDYARQYPLMVDKVLDGDEFAAFIDWVAGHTTVCLPIEVGGWDISDWQRWVLDSKQVVRRSEGDWREWWMPVEALPPHMKEIFKDVPGDVIHVNCEWEVVGIDTSDRGCPLGEYYYWKEAMGEPPTDVACSAEYQEWLERG